MQQATQRKWPVELTVEFIKANSVKEEPPEDKDENGRYRIYEGARVGRLTIIEETYDPEGRRGRWWLTRCRCGNEKIAAEKNLKGGITRSCGCLLKQSILAAVAARSAQVQAAKRERMSRMGEL